MDVDPMEYVEDDDEKAEEKAAEEKARRDRSRLNTLVAITVALLATFMGICNVKDNNIVQAMQQAQADKIDNYAWYQARNIREEVARATVVELTAQLSAVPVEARAIYQQQIDTYQKLADEQAQKKREQQEAADQA